MDPYLARARSELAFRMGLRSAADEERVLGFLADALTAVASYRSWTQRGLEARGLDQGRMHRAFETMTAVPLAGVGSLLVTIELSLPQPPHETNGQWVDSLRCVRWQGWCAALSYLGASLPLTCAASWSVPDSVMQHRLFGRVAVDADSLSLYADWFETLTPARQADWNRMLLSLRPGRLGPLDRFRFADQRGTGDAALLGKILIREALEENAED